MESLSDLSKYHELRKRIIRNEELSDADWELFFELEMKNREIKHQKETWDNLFMNSVLLPEQKQETIKKAPGFKVFSGFKPLYSRNFQYAYAVLLLFFMIGFLSYSVFHKEDVKSPEALSLTSVDKQQEPYLNSSIEKKQDIIKKEDDLLVYAENPYLENYISDVVRSVSDNMEITSPQPSVRYKLKEGTGTLTLNFSGTLFSQKNPEANIFIKVFSNNPDEYSNDLPLFQEQIKFEESGPGFIFTKKINYPAKKGLYYFTLEDTVNDDILYLNKFYIY